MLPNNLPTFQPNNPITFQPFNLPTYKTKKATPNGAAFLA
ncbi:hypothetical protein C943_01418 [Mariniradius saccharolyticus AK6]|uniref:Uncharacterized protein n=1 Tax=Mariniradius saccharolyticus AK6 TaxID=1239962 RepID=M7Y4G9_9BACT|nr:hypothetical protein C943_01418 [Mariniradius saccharolyticus AK6]